MVNVDQTSCFRSYFVNIKKSDSNKKGSLELTSTNVSVFD